MQIGTSDDEMWWQVVSSRKFAAASIRARVLTAAAAFVGCD